LLTRSENLNPISCIRCRNTKYKRSRTFGAERILTSSGFGTRLRTLPLPRWFTLSDVKSLQTHSEHQILYNLDAQSKALDLGGDCMNKNYGLSVRFIPQSNDLNGTKIDLLIEYKQLPMEI